MISYTLKYTSMRIRLFVVSSTNIRRSDFLSAAVQTQTRGIRVYAWCGCGEGIRNNGEWCYVV